MSSLMHQKHNGQAMTEFVVSVAFIFMVLFVIVPTFGKIIDMKMTTQQASRYAAWERTVWLESMGAWNSGSGDANTGDFVISADEFESVALRDDAALQNSVASRFFYGQGGADIVPISSVDISGPGAAGTESSLWTYHQSGQPMLGQVEVFDLSEEKTPSVAYDVIDFLGDGLEAITTPLEFMLNLVGGGNEDLLKLDYNRSGYYKPSVRTTLNAGNAKGGGNGEWDRNSGAWGSGIEDAIFQQWDGRFVSNSAILADGWNAQSVDYYQDRVDNFVPSTVFDNVLFDAFKTAASLLEAGPAQSAIYRLDFGEMQVEPMPTEEITCDDGHCYYDD
ncbi:TadE family protein [Gilvimarinus sp. 1_MG-2023]|uniref:TadE family protein n=1 Tax=Gilvimarinus sp. 1_MG-2023 TaxID=3062638 RepID=UPI0026E4408F|nr:TadE family protein [Gilvimarinus sp. 1_MG-2023]MDO6748349.1 pilus assembly protein [Gilvimarinus sp. 1_MG-2023]